MTSLRLQPKSEPCSIPTGELPVEDRNAPAGYRNGLVHNENVLNKGHIGIRDMRSVEARGDMNQRAGTRNKQDLLHLTQRQSQQSSFSLLSGAGHRDCKDDRDANSKEETGKES